MGLKRALSVSDVLNYKANVLPFDGKFEAAIGQPELTGTWIIWGNSVNGKTRFAIQLAKYIAGFCRVAYDSLEEGLSESLKKAIREEGMADVARRFILLDKEPVSDLAERLRKRRSPDVVFIDSLQYTGMSYRDYKTLRDEFRNKLFVFVSHADGRDPQGSVAKSVRYDAFVKIYIEGYKAFAQSRYGGGNEYVIWDKGAEDYWNFK